MWNIKEIMMSFYNFSDVLTFQTLRDIDKDEKFR